MSSSWVFRLVGGLVTGGLAGKGFSLDMEARFTSNDCALLRWFDGRPMLDRLLPGSSAKESWKVGLFGEFCRDLRCSGRVNRVRVSRRVGSSTVSARSGWARCTGVGRGIWLIGLSNFEEVATRAGPAPSLLCCRARNVSRKDFLYFG